MHGDLAEVKDAVTTVQGVISGQDTKLNIAIDVMDQSQSEIAQLSQKVQTTHEDVSNTKGVVSRMHGDLAEVKDAVTTVQGVISGQDTKLNIARDVMDQSQSEIAQLSQKVQTTHEDV